MYKNNLESVYYGLRNEFRKIYGKTPRIKNMMGEVEVGVLGHYDIIEVVSNRGKYRFAHDVHSGITATEILPWPYEPRHLTEQEINEVGELALDIIRGGFTHSWADARPER